MNDLQKDIADYAKQLWGLTSAIAAFCALQTLAFVYKFADCDFRVAAYGGLTAIFIAIPLATLAYVGAIGVLERQHHRLVEANSLVAQTVRIVAICKIGVVILSALGAIALCLVLASQPRPVCGQQSALTSDAGPFTAVKAWFSLP